MSRFLSERIAGMAPYVPGEQLNDKKYVKLNTNESPFPPSPAVAAVLTQSAAGGLRLYPDPQAGKLREAVARRCGIDASQVFTGNGSDEVLAFVFMAFGGAGVCTTDLTYGFYPVWAELYGQDYAEIPLNSDLTLPADRLTGTGRMTIFANPNAPTGLMLTLPELERIVAGSPDNLVIIDEAYVDFGAQTAVPLIDKYDNLLIVQTLSKSRQLAGGRLGLAMGDASLIADLDRVRYSFHPYNVDALAIEIGAAAMDDAAYFDTTRREIIAVREEAKREFAAMGFTVTDSAANFLFVRHDRIGGQEYYRKLKDLGILVRWFNTERIVDWVRISVGSRSDMAALYAATQRILGGVK